MKRNVMGNRRRLAAWSRRIYLKRRWSLLKRVWRFRELSPKEKVFLNSINRREMLVWAAELELGMGNA